LESHLHGALEPKEIAELFGEPIDPEDLYSEAIETWESCRQSNLVDRTLQFYTEIYLQDGILPKVDRASMLHGLEVRSPFLDLEVANFARKLPHHFKLRNGVTKYLLKKAVEPLLPAEIIHRKKWASAPHRLMVRLRRPRTAIPRALCSATRGDPAAGQSRECITRAYD